MRNQDDFLDLQPCKQVAIDAHIATKSDHTNVFVQKKLKNLLLFNAR